MASFHSCISSKTITVILSFHIILTLFPPPGACDDALVSSESGANPWMSVKDAMGDLMERIVRVRRELPRQKDEAKEGFTEEEKDAVLLLHNSLRSTVNPSAANMVELTWDNSIEAFAQDWANQCSGDHRSSRNLNEWINMGENLYWLGGGYYNLKTPMDFWWGEKKDYNIDTHTCTATGNDVCGHYITAAWAMSVKIGCGIKRCANLPFIDRKVYYFVCNYNDRFLSSKVPYEKGEACSNCPPEFPKCRYNLCVTQSMFDDCTGYNGSTTWIGVERTSTKSSDGLNCSSWAEGNGGGATQSVGGTTPSVGGTTPSVGGTTTDVASSIVSNATTILVGFVVAIVAVVKNNFILVAVGLFYFYVLQLVSFMVVLNLYFSISLFFFFFSVVPYYGTMLGLSV